MDLESMQAGGKPAEQEDLQMGTKWDQLVPGLGIKRNKRGSVWVLKYRFAGRQVWTTLGDIEMLTREEARALARVRKWAAKNGEAPPPKRRSSSLRVVDFCKIYLERHAKPQKKSWHKDQSRIRLYIAPLLGHLRLTDVDKRLIATIHQDIGSTKPYAANRVLEQLQTMFNLAAEWGYMPENLKNPAAGIRAFPETKRTRWLTSEEMSRLAAVLGSLPGGYSTYFWLLLLTGCRRSEMATLRWSHVDLEAGFIHFPKTKSGKPHTLPLSSAAMALLCALPARNAYVFPGRKKDDHWKRPDKVWQKIRRAANIPDVRLHDLRHTAASWLVQQKHSLETVRALLNHSTLHTTQRYTHLGNEHLREALEDYSKTLPVSRAG